FSSAVETCSSHPLQVIPWTLILYFFIGNTFHGFTYFYSLTFNNLKLFSVTSNVAPISENIAIHSVNQPGITNSNATNLIAKEKVIFCLIIAKALRLNLMVYDSLLRSSDINAISAVSSAV